MRVRFTERPCLVTGAERGIGRAIAEGLAADGAHVGIMARTELRCDAVVAGIGSSTAVFLVGDLHTTRRSRSARSPTCRRGSAPCGAWSKAAGISPVQQRAEKLDLPVFREVVDVNLAGVKLKSRSDRRSTPRPVSPIG